VARTSPQVKHARARAIPGLRIRLLPCGPGETVPDRVETRGVLVIPRGQGLELRDEGRPRKGGPGKGEDNEQHRDPAEGALHRVVPRQEPGAAWRSLNRWILPVAVLGSSTTKSIHRGYL